MGLLRWMRPASWWLFYYDRANAAWRIYRSTGNAKALDEALANYAAFANPPEIEVVLPRDRPAVLNGLAMCYLCRFKDRGQPSDIDLAVDTLRNRVLRLKQGPAEESDHLANLADALLSRYAAFGARADLEQAEAAAIKASSLPGIHAHAKAVQLADARSVHIAPRDLDVHILSSSCS